MKTYTNNGVTIKYSDGYASIDDYYSVLKLNLKILLNRPSLQYTTGLIDRYRADIAAVEKAIGIS